MINIAIAKLRSVWSNFQQVRYAISEQMSAVALRLLKLNPPPSGEDELRLYKRCEKFSFVYFPLLLVVLYVFSIKQTNFQGDCPVVIDLNRNGQIDITGFTATQDKLYTLFSTGRFVDFDVWGSGDKAKIDWIKGGTDGIIVEWDANNPKKEFTGLDLMGVRRIGDDGSDIDFDNGFEKMKSFDTNADGELAGEEVAKLAIWVDNGNAILEDGEIFSFAAKNITSLSVNAETETSFYGFDALRSRASGPGLSFMMEDVWFLNADVVPAVDRQIAGVLTYTGL